MIHRRLLVVALLPLALACGSGDDGSAADVEPALSEAATPATAPAAESAAVAPARTLVDLLAQGQAVFGIFSGEKSRAGGEAVMSSQRADFQLYSMEQGPFDVPTLAAYIEGMVAAGGPSAPRDFPVVVRTPAIHTAPDTVAEYARDAMTTPIAGITFPHVTNAQEAARSVAILGEPWPLSDAAESVNILIVEDREGIANVREIMQTPGLSVVFAGPGDLRRAYEGDMEAVEGAIQTVLAACLEFGVACGVTAGVDDIVGRLDEGFRVIIVTEPEAVDVGMRHAGRLDVAGG